MNKPKKLLLEGSNSCTCTDEEGNWQDCYGLCWEDTCEYLTELMDKHEYWYIRMEHFGWRGISGEKYVKLEKGEQFLHAILPNTECSFKIYKRGKNILVNNAHHDSPMWAEWYIAKPISAKIWEDNQ